MQSFSNATRTMSLDMDIPRNIGKWNGSKNYLLAQVTSSNYQWRGLDDETKIKNIREMTRSIIHRTEVKTTTKHLR